MPQFLDHHTSPAPPPAEMISQISEDLRAGGHTDPATGVKAISWMYNDREQWCVSEAPSADAVHKYHESMGLRLGPGDVTEIKVVR